ncbi:hypothetical protein A2U01_0102722 [Trifolium medium]|uniref:Uncharacterized protein n=1 Tax=Trifolium medium TaxID=97028 RepID=A0A392V2I5_9FABA|nr:hypothetical protein [Trifolium medium]
MKKGISPLFSPLPSLPNSTAAVKQNTTGTTAAATHFSLLPEFSLDQTSLSRRREPS